MADRSKDWIEQADRDLLAAKSQIDAGFHEWACFIAQQCAEKAAKSVLQRLGAEAWGHSVNQLLAAISDDVPLPEDVKSAAMVLDRYYIPARYPNGYAEGKPADYIARKDANDAVASAEKILRFCNDFLAR